MMFFTVKCWLNFNQHKQLEPGWVLPVDAFIVVMLLIEVSTHVLISGWKKFVQDRYNLLDLGIALLSAACVVPEFLDRIFAPDNTLSTLDFIRDVLRLARAILFARILREILRQPTTTHGEVSFF